MGCCFGKGSEDDQDAGGMEMGEPVTNEAVLCRIGLKGDNIKFKEEPAGKAFNVTGQGTVLGSSSLDCDIGYWEVTLGKKPQGIRVGIKRFNKKRAVPLTDHLEADPKDKTPTCWILDPKDIEDELKEGQVIGVHWDQSDFPMVSFSINGKLHSKASINRIRPANDLYPAVSLEEGSTATLAFNEEAFKSKPWAPKFRMIVSATNIM
jgi:hypothetical protein